RRLVEVDGEHPRPVRRQPRADDPADRAAGAGHDRDPALEAPAHRRRAAVGSGTSVLIHPTLLSAPPRARSRPRPPATAAGPPAPSGTGGPAAPAAARRLANARSAFGLPEL